MRAVVLFVAVGCGRVGFNSIPSPAGDAAKDGATVDQMNAENDGAVGMPGDGGTSGIVCGEAMCQPVVGAYISHFTARDCTGTESYYTPYFSGGTMPNPDGKIYSWDGNGLAGTIYRTVTNKSYKDMTGACTNAWPTGNTLDYFVTIYR